MAEDLDGIYSMTDSLFQRVRPYVRIGREYAFQPKAQGAWREFDSAPRRTFQPPKAAIPIDSLTVEVLILDPLERGLCRLPPPPRHPLHRGDARVEFYWGFDHRPIDPLAPLPCPQAGPL